MTDGPDPRPFDVCGPLPRGVTILEASAGTGKTFTIAALATRFVAEGVASLDQMLLVTFTRMATGELRERVRDQLVAAERALTDAVAGRPTDPDDALITMLASGARGDVIARRDRLGAAVAGFDAATIDTIHAFCMRALNGLGVAADADPDAVFVEGSTDLVDEVVTDFYLRKFADRTSSNLTIDEARRIALSVVTNPDAAIFPPLTGDEGHDIRSRFATAVRSEVERRRRLTRVLTFDDLLTRLDGTLADPDHGPVARRWFRDHYRVALVDEFQDTDTIQWDILRRAFVDTDTDATLVLIGDPKQAIYAFRGADVYAYLDAVTVATAEATLRRNWRSDQALIDAYDALFDGARLGHPGIVYRPVEAAAGDSRRMTGAPVAEPLRVRVVHRDDDLAPTTQKGDLALDGARAVIADDVASDIVRLLSSRAHIASPDGPVAIRPAHIAVLVQRNEDANTIRDALHEVDVPAVLAGAGSVFATPAARDWQQLLAALERPSAANPVHALALTAFVGWTAERVATASDADWEALHARAHQWGALLRRRGVAAMFHTIARTERLAARVLGRVDGDRTLTDLRHIGELLHAEVMAEQLGITALNAWLHDRRSEAWSDAGTEDHARRLESDAEAVQVLTVYRSKGLEFPVVYCPYLWHPGWIDDGAPPIYHDDDGRRTVDVARTVYGRKQQIIETRGEELRLAYVALTRAKHQAVIWWASSAYSHNSCLGRLLFAKDADGNVDTWGSAPPDDAQVVARIEQLEAKAPGCLSVERVDGGGGAHWTGSAGAATTLRVSNFDRSLDQLWRRTSFTSITSDAHDAWVASEDEEPLIVDERSTAAVTSIAGDMRLRTIALPLAAMRGGTEVGTFVHGVLEDCDFAADDLDGALAGAFAAQTARRAVEIGDAPIVLSGLRAAVETPLGPLVDDLRLRDIGRTDRVDELTFELPLAGGDVPTGSLDMAAIAEVLDRHLEPSDPLLTYAQRLRDPALAGHVRGYLTGSLDLVLRTPDHRYAVVDYKTNWLGAAGDELTAWHYRPAALVEAMELAHYPLQALLYTVALHRYLRWRVPDYSAGHHLAGVLYLFVRGMLGADPPRVDGQPCGVFAWRPPAALVESLSEAFDIGSVTA